jgi:UDP-sugar pyrophosphorylase
MLGSSGEQIPLVIMTSDDTHYKTQELLETNKYFGMLPDQIQLLKQEKVACLVDNDAKLALDPSNPFLIQVYLQSSLCHNGLQYRGKSTKQVRS